MRVSGDLLAVRDYL